jgi:predicted component of type VI protein secretion system
MMVMLAAGLSLAGTPDNAIIKSAAERAWQADVAAWADYAFRRHVTRQTFDEEDNETFRLELLFELTPQSEGWDELLLEIDGAEPKKGEVKDHHKAARFTKHYAQAAELKLDNPIGEDLALLPVIQDQEHRFIGEDLVDGIPCYRTQFDSRPEPDGLSPRERLKYAIEGTACFSKDGYHLVVFEMETVRPVKQGGIGMTFLRMTLKGQAVGDAWLLKLVELRSDVVLLGKHMRKGNIYRYTDFRYQPAK